MLHKAWNSKEEMPYCFPRSSIKFQGHTGQKITDFDPNWAFPDNRPVAAFKSLRFALLFRHYSAVLMEIHVLTLKSLLCDWFGFHRRCWRQASASPLSTWTVTLITFPFLWMVVMGTGLLSSEVLKADSITTFTPITPNTSIDKAILIVIFQLSWLGVLWEICIHFSWIAVEPVPADAFSAATISIPQCTFFHSLLTWCLCLLGNS